MNNSLAVKNQDAQTTLNYNILFDNCSQYIDKNASNYMSIIKSLKYLSKKSYFDDTVTINLLRDCTALYISKIIEDELTGSIMNYVEKSIKGIFK